MRRERVGVSGADVQSPQLWVERVGRPHAAIRALVERQIPNVRVPFSSKIPEKFVAVDGGRLLICAIGPGTFEKALC